MVLRDQDFPALFRDFDRTAIRSQRRYINLIRGNLLLLVAGATASGLSTDKVSLHIVSALLLVAGLALTIFIMVASFEREWYGGRAAAETAKSLSWKYMMRADPFVADYDADALLLDSLNEILQDHQLALAHSAEVSTTDQITAAMRDLRSLSVEKRRDVYVRDRLTNQRNWYSSKSEENARSARFWFQIMLAVQGLAVAAALVQVALPRLPVNMASVFAAGAAAALAWLQTKRFQELRQSYAVAAHELGLIKSRASAAVAEAQLAQFVNDAETAISREHTMWIARREGVVR